MDLDGEARKLVDFLFEDVVPRPDRSTIRAYLETHGHAEVIADLRELPSPHIADMWSLERSLCVACVQNSISSTFSEWWWMSHSRPAPPVG
jgi:hypothetical protein